MVTTLFGSCVDANCSSDPRLKIARCNDGDDNQGPNPALKEKKPAPLVISNITSSRIKALMLANGIKSFNISQTGTTVRLFTETREKHNRAISVLDSVNIEFFNL